MIKSCLVCQRPVKGRTDKKFCSDACRNHFHNERNRKEKSYTRLVNRRLRQNRIILSGLLANDRKRIQLPVQEFIKQGFDLSYHTHFLWSTSKDCYVCCYDFAFRVIAKQYIEVIRTDTDVFNEYFVN